MTASESERRRRVRRHGGVLNTGAPGESIERTYQRIMANLEKA